MYGEGAVTDRMCQKWFAKFHAGDFSLDDDLCLGRPFEVDSDQIETLTENNQCYTIWEKADILKVSKSIELLVKMKKNVSFTLWKKLNGFLGGLFGGFFLPTQYFPVSQSHGAFLPLTCKNNLCEMQIYQGNFFKV